jgi:hypothetical protein
MSAQAALRRGWGGLSSSPWAAHVQTHSTALRALINVNATAPFSTAMIEAGAFIKESGELTEGLRMATGVPTHKAGTRCIYASRNRAGAMAEPAAERRRRGADWGDGAPATPARGLATLDLGTAPQPRDRQGHSTRRGARPMGDGASSPGSGVRQQRDVQRPGRAARTIID